MFFRSGQAISNTRLLRAKASGYQLKGPTTPRRLFFDAEIVGFMPDSSPEIISRRRFGGAVQAFIEYALLCLMLELNLTSAIPGISWHVAPLALVPWLLVRGSDIRRPLPLDALTASRRWTESHLLGLTLSGAALRFFFEVNGSLLLGLFAAAMGVLLAVELVFNTKARTAVLAWFRYRAKLLWPRAGVVGAVGLAVWLWDRLVLREDLSVAIYAWIFGVTSAVVWLIPDSASKWWRAIIAPVVAVIPIIGFLADTPGQSAGSLVLLALLALGASSVHTAFARGRGMRSIEIAWIWVLAVGGFWLSEPLLHAQGMGGGDAHWYTLVMADAIAQWRAGIFPPFVGQSIYAFSGSSFPGCFAPYYQLAGIAIDSFTGGNLSPFAIQHTTAFLSILGGIFSACGVLRALAREQRAPAALLALLYGASPAWLGALYSMDMYMTTMTLPWLPLVFFGCVRTFVHLNFVTAAWLVAPLSAVWYAHPPIALWTTLAVVASQFFRLATRRRDWRTEVIWLSGTATLFAALTCLPFASAGSAERSGDIFRHDYVLRTMAEHWATAWKPVSSGADRMSDQHLGWSLALVALAGGFLAMWKNQRSLCALITASSCLLLLLIPLPVAQEAIWRAIPEAIKSVTNNWPTQRIYPVLASLSAVACGVALLRMVRHRPRAQRWLTVGLLCSVAWSFSEARKFQHRGHVTTLNPEASARRLHPENLVLTRYAYEMFSRKPDYLAHGVMNPLMKHRLLDEKSLEELSNNSSAASNGAKSKTITFRNLRDPAGKYEPTPALHIRPGRQYLLEFDFESRDYIGNLSMTSERIERNYHLPSDGGPRAFGSGATQGRFITLWTSGGAPETVRWHFQPETGPPPVGRFATVRMTEIEQERLPVQLESLLPYQTIVRTNEPAWLETPRMFLQGYKAQVGGHPVEVRKSPQGLAMLLVPAGETHVKLQYVGPTLVRVAFWVALFTWIATVIRIATLAGKLTLPRRAPASTTPGGSRALPEASGAS